MIELVPTNVLLKGSHRRQVMAWLKRSLRLGQRVGDFALKITIHKSGSSYEVKADVHDQAGSFTCRSRAHEVLDACRDMAQSLSTQLHKQRLQRLAA